MKPDPLKHLWALAREHTEPPPAAEPLPPGMATRIAAQWAASRPQPHGALWEGVSLASLAVALAVCGCAALLRPGPPPAREPDLFAQLLIAEPAPADFPF